MDRADPVLAPPYDPELEERTTERRPARRATRTSSTRSLRTVLNGRDPFRLKVMRRHIKWARKQAIKAGIEPEAVDLWQV